MKPLWKLRGDILDAVDRKVNFSLNQRFLDLFNKKALPPIFARGAS